MDNCKDESSFILRDSSLGALSDTLVSSERKVRKGYKKSRKGCLNCKKARIKCKENHPVCDYCDHRGLGCEWPEIQSACPEISIHRPSPDFQIPSSIQISSPVFSMVDFRLFHHFIQEAYPHHPIGNDSVWIHEIPSIASNHDYLLGSMLALSASDLASDPTASTASRNLTCTAIHHRVKAIASLNAVISSGVNSFEEGNAMLATCFILLFQSTLISDDLVEYMTFIRGTIAVAMCMGSQRIKFIFHELWGNQEVNSMDLALQQTPLIDGELAKSACRSIESLLSLCKSQGELDMYGALLITARSLITSSKDAYLSLRSIYNIFSFKMSHEEFRDLTRTSNEVGNAILAHFVALQLIMTPITRVERLQRDTRLVVRDKFNDRKTVKWLRHLHANVPHHMKEYFEWTRYVEDEMITGKYFGDEWQ